MSAKLYNKLDVVFCWHMHQPEYRDLMTGEYQLPWVYLHAIKDYTDMVYHLENNPGAKCVINFSPILLDQLQDYQQNLQQYLEEGKTLRDPLLRALASDDLDFSPEEIIQLITQCAKANKDTIIDRFSEFRKLHYIAKKSLQDPQMIRYIAKNFIADLVTWYHIAWLGESIRRKNTTIQSLIKKSHSFSHKDRLAVITVIDDIMHNLMQRYKALFERNQIELSTTPYAHPITPLLLDFACAKDSIPDTPLPNTELYPDGVERSQWHLKRGFETFFKCFGHHTVGCWPSEGGICQNSLEHYSQYGIEWLASGENVLRNTLHAAGWHDTNGSMHQLFQGQNSNIKIFFRDDGLSDLIGFSYATWDAEHAVNDFISHLESIQKQHQNNPDALVAIIMDGENAWEYYPENAYHFLDLLYHKLSTHPRLNMDTFTQCCKRKMATKLPHLTAGSWVHGTFSTWIGETSKNIGWDLLASAKTEVDKAIQNKELSDKSIETALTQLAVCEGSDWCWWFGDYNPSGSVNDFDQLYRVHLKNLYANIGKLAPLTTSQTISALPAQDVQQGDSHGSAEAGGVMRRGS